MTNPRFEALSRMCLNNWHYIQHKVLSFHEGINFFTGHSGSGKSTVIDAMQIVLYANTDGRGFFNKAAADDSDRSLMEYLRGMINIGDDNRFSYLRNQNFSSTIVLELKRTDTGESQCVGVVFDVEVASNEISRMFFWHRGPLPDHCYRLPSRTMSTEEVKAWLLEHFTKEDCYFGSHNERFRKQLYDVYLGGLDPEKFPLLFKRAIPFRMNIKLEEFVKEYICMEQDIHIEDMQHSVMQYGRLRKSIEDTCREMEQLQEICAQYQKVSQAAEEMRTFRYFADRLDILQRRRKGQESREKILQMRQQKAQTDAEISRLQAHIGEMTARSEELLRQIAATGYDQLKDQLASLNALIERRTSSRARWTQTAQRLKAWEEEDIVSNRTLWDIEAFQNQTISEEGLSRLQQSLKGLRTDVEKQQQDARAQLRELQKRCSQAQEELGQLKRGGKAYPRELEQARTILQNRLYQETGKSVSVEILADLLDVRDDSWRNAVEGYMGNNKLLLVVEPRYARLAMQIYEELDREIYYRVAVLDTERVMADEHTVLPDALAEEVMAAREYAQAYIRFLLGRVIKCRDVDQLRSCRIGITKECVMYHSYRIQHINPSLYGRQAYIGKSSVRQRIRLLEKSIKEMEEEQLPQQQILEDAKRVLDLEYLSQELPVYLEWKEDLETLQENMKDQKRLEEKLRQLKSQNVEAWEAERKALLELCEQQKEVLKQQEKNRNDLERDEKEEQARLTAAEEELLEKERSLPEDSKAQKQLDELLAGMEPPRYDLLCIRCQGKEEEAGKRRQEAFSRLVELRTSYLRTYQNRDFSPTSESNDEYEKLLQDLSCDRLDEYRAEAARQAQTAVEHFKDDFMYKIRSAIKEALQRKDELNRIISRLDFGKDKYQFYIGKNKGPDGKYYDMFMDEALSINPSDLDIGLDNQLNLFTMEHENQYGAMINELISMFIPPENATAEEMEEARRNMDRYADYRTYLSFDMQQLIQNEDETIKIRLSRMIKKNSGGEGQNPLYVALLASFAQAYKIDLKPGLMRSPTIRLVVLDEAFSKMDAEKVASCIQLIRGLGFQAIISATNDKIQNYLETVDKIFVFANPNKKAISIQEFERMDFKGLKEELEENLE